MEYGISCFFFFFIMNRIRLCVLDFTMLCASEIINHIMHPLSSNPDHVSHSASIFLIDLQGFVGEIPRTHVLFQGQPGFR
jgi:hypothetical protein